MLATPAAEEFIDAARLLRAARAEAEYPRRGALVALSSPSGAGKSSLTRALLAADANLALSVSATTRARRPGEVDGDHYVFLAREEFMRRVAAGEMLEWAEVFGNLYGTPRAPVEAWLAKGVDVLFDIDWQGARQLRAAAPESVVDIFIIPPSLEELERRLTARGQDSAEVIAARMAKAEAEISHWGEYAYLVVNEAFGDALAKIAAILLAERLKRARQEGLNADIAARLAARGLERA